MAKLILMERNGEIKKAYEGFSWTVFFFGFFPPLFRGHFMGAIVILGINILVYTLYLQFSVIMKSNFLLSIVIDIIYIGIAIFIPFEYNKYHMDDLINNGYKRVY